MRSVSAPLTPRIRNPAVVAPDGNCSVQLARVAPRLKVAALMLFVPEPSVTEVVTLLLAELVSRATVLAVILLLTPANRSVPWPRLPRFPTPNVEPLAL